MEGYDSLAVMMGKYPELCIFRRFSTLNYRNLLLMQAELMEKEDVLLSAIQDDQASIDPERRSFAVDFRAMLENTTEGGRKQREIALGMRPLLKEYSKC